MNGARERANGVCVCKCMWTTCVHYTAQTNCTAGWTAVASNFSTGITKAEAKEMCAHLDVKLKVLHLLFWYAIQLQICCRNKHCQLSFKHTVESYSSFCVFSQQKKCCFQLERKFPISAYINLKIITTSHGNDPENDWHTKTIMHTHRNNKKNTVNENKGLVWRRWNWFINFSMLSSSQETTFHTNNANFVCQHWPIFEGNCMSTDNNHAFPLLLLSTGFPNALPKFILCNLDWLNQCEHGIYY